MLVLNDVLRFFGGKLASPANPGFRQDSKNSKIRRFHGLARIEPTPWTQKGVLSVQFFTSTITYCSITAFAARVFVFVCFFSLPAFAEDAAEWVPDTTQGFVRVVDLPRMLTRWKQTQPGQLADDQRLKDFWSEQRQEIEERFSAAGWQLNLHLEDINAVTSGQVAMAWIAKPQDTQKAFAVALALETRGNEALVTKLLSRIDQDLKAAQATTDTVDHKGVTITRYTLPRGAGALSIKSSLYAQTSGHLLASDDLATLQYMIDSSMSPANNSLAKSALFKQSTDHIKTAGADSDIEYFVQPIGLANLLRAISGKPVNTQTDALKVLTKEGFDKISAVCGRVQFGNGKFDVYHDAFAQTEPPLPVSVQVLDFPNSAPESIPSWVTPEASTLLALAWNSKDAFWKVKGIVDGMAGQEGVFDSVIEGIQIDPVGPQIDIKKDVLPYLTPEIYSLADTVEPITPDSRRTLIAIRIQDPNKKLASVLERAMKNEPDAKAEDFMNYRLWKVTRVEDDESVDLEGDFGNFGNKSKANPNKPAAAAPPAPILNNWAITIYDDFMMFASHADMIKEAITADKAGAKKLLENEPDVKKVRELLKEIANNNPSCVWQINRADRAFEMQYELFRQDKLPQSRSMLATILDRLLRPKDEIKKVDQKVKGDKLPPFSQIKPFLMPGGSRIQTFPDGWSYQGFVISKQELGGG